MFVAVGGKSYLVGISSYTSGFAPGLNSKYGSLSGAVDLEWFHPSIFENTGVSAVPEAGALWFFPLGGLPVWTRRR